VITGALLAVTLVMLIGLAANVLWPFFDWNSKTVAYAPLLQYERLLYAKEAVLENLRDIEQDYLLEKLNKADYEELRSKVMQQAAQIYGAIDQIEMSDDLFARIEKEIAILEKNLGGNQK